MNRIIQYLSIFFVLFLFACGSSLTKKTAENLKVALNNERTASEKYTKYAQVAMSEGFDTLAQLFSAVSNSEKIHAMNHERMLHKYGGNSDNPEIAAYQVKTTKENLDAAIKSEMLDMQSLYPGFIKTAEIETAPDGATAFTWALNGDKRHLNFYRKAASSILSGNEFGISYLWYVCPRCGNIYNPDDSRALCEICLEKQENFIGFVKIDSK
jgi:rubrerythrin